jgi:hypothetical protein
VCCLIDGVIQLHTNDGYSPWLLWMNRNCHADLMLLHATCHGLARTVDRYNPIVAEVEKCIVKHLGKRRAMLDCGTKPPILSDGDMGVVAHVHLKSQP